MPRSGPGPTTGSPSTSTAPVGRPTRARRRCSAASTCRSPTRRAGRRARRSPTSRSTPSRARTVSPRRPAKSFTEPAHRQARRSRSGGGGCGGRCHQSSRAQRRRPVAEPAQGQVADEADHAEHDQQGEHAVDAPEALGPDDPERQALLGGEQLGDDEHQPRRGQVDAGDVDDAGPASAGGSPAAARSTGRRRACTTR